MPLHTLTENKTYGLSLAIAQLTSFKKKTHDHQNALCMPPYRIFGYVVSRRKACDVPNAVTRLCIGGPVLTISHSAPVF